MRRIFYSAAAVDGRRGTAQLFPRCVQWGAQGSASSIHPEKKRLGKPAVVVHRGGSPQRCWLVMPPVPPLAHGAYILYHSFLLPAGYLAATSFLASFPLFSLSLSLSPSFYSCHQCASSLLSSLPPSCAGKTRCRKRWPSQQPVCRRATPVVSARFEIDRQVSRSECAGTTLFQTFRCPLCAQAWQLHPFPVAHEGKALLRTEPSPIAKRRSLRRCARGCLATIF